MPRDDIPIATCKRLLKLNSDSNTTDRTSIKAAKEVQKALVSLLHKAAKEASDQLRVATGDRKKGPMTVTEGHIELIFLNSCKGITELSLRQRPQPGEIRGLPKTAIVRVFKEQLGGAKSGKGKVAAYRVGTKAAATLVAACEAYIAAIAKTASVLAKSGKRKTIQDKDVLSALAILA